MNNQIYPCLWFDGQAKAAAQFYCSIFSNASITTENPMVVIWQINGQQFMGLNGGPMFTINPSISLFVKCGSLDETNEIWSKLIDGGKAMMPIDTYPWSKRYGWLQDKFGLTWQIMIDAKEGGNQKIAPALLFTKEQLGKTQEAIQYYTGIFENSAIDMVAHYPPEDAANAGKLMYAEFNLNQQDFVAMEGPADFGFNEGVSFVISCQTQAEIDYYWNHLIADGGAESQCGWCKDKYGVSWQVLPAILSQLMSHPQKGPRVVEAFMQMKKFDIETLLNA